MLMEPLPRTDSEGANQPRKQVGALAWRFDQGVLKVLLVTSRDTGRFVIPKGWPMKRLSNSRAAAREAYEEAGVGGKTSSQPIGSYEYNKIFGPGFALQCRVTVYSMQVAKVLSKWPEKSERTRHWMTLDEAAANVDEPELSAIIEEFVPVV